MLADHVFSKLPGSQLTLNLAGPDVVRDILGAAAVNLAASAEGSSEDLKGGTLQVLGHGLEAHGTGNADDLIKRNALGVLDVLLLLTVSGRLLEGLDDEGRSGGNDGDGGLTVLDGQLDSDTETLPVTSGLGDIFTDLYGLVRLIFFGGVCVGALKTYSWERDREDQSWERARMRHRLHHRSHGGE